MKVSPIIAILFATLATTSSVGADRSIHLEVQSNANVTNYTVAGDGTYRSVMNQVLALRADRQKSDQEVLLYIQQNRDNLPPPYFLEAMRRSCSSDPAAAWSWLNLYSIRARYDALRCVDPSAMDNVQAVLFELQAPECQSQLKSSHATITAGLSKMLSQADVFASKASPWWICSGGMGVIMQTLQSSPNEGTASTSTVTDSQWLRPKAQWPTIQQKLIADFRKQLSR